MTYVTTRDIIIPAGTEIAAPPTRSTRWGKDFEAVVAIGKDHTGYFSIGLQGAVKAGLVVQTAQEKTNEHG